MGESTIGLILIVGSVLISLKCLLIPAYVSTDFEVHRNWMAVTKNKKLVEWYTEKTSEWTLDYPPFFAYFERVLAALAEFLNIQDALKISKNAVFNQQILVFQRVSVIMTDVFYIFTCALYSFHSEKLVEKIPPKAKSLARQACFVLLSCSQALLMIDSIHFQYNSMLTSFFILSMYFIDKEDYLKGAFCFSVLLNFKHIYVYYALGYVFYYLSNYFKWEAGQVFRNYPRLVFLSIPLAVPIIASFGPFLYFGGIQSIEDIAKRLFPFSRGLTHAFWAPNFWALYNFADLLLYRLSILSKGYNFKPPTYTTGLVQEYNHSVLPNVSTGSTLVLVIISSVLFLSAIMVRKIERNKSTPRETPDFALFAVVSSLCFFFFGYHVHEKAIILITIPMTVFAIKDIKQIPNLIFISTIASFSLFPLLFTPFEILLKYSIAMTYFLLQVVMFQRLLGVSFTMLVPTRNLQYFLTLVLLELYNTFVHKWLWNGRFEFAPLMVISIATSSGVFVLFLSLVVCKAFDGKIKEKVQMVKCEMKENFMKNMKYHDIESEEDVSLIGGVDISASKTNPDIAVIALSIYKYPENKHVVTFSENVIMEMPYIPQYLAVREANVVEEFVKKVIGLYPQYRPDLLMCDGFGQFHSRGCGMACHVGSHTDIPTIGVAKNLSLHDIPASINEKKVIEKYLDGLRKIFETNKKKRGYVPFDVISPVTMNVVRINGSQSGVFVSVGCGISLDLATRIAVQTMENSTTCEPIRHADLSSREVVRRYFE